MLEEPIVNVEEITLTCNDGISLAAQRWTSISRNKNSGMNATTKRTRKVLCLHGYLDNCRSFHLLCPRLVSTYHHETSSGVEAVAIDFPGHGRSSHKSADHPPMMVISDFVYYVSESIRLLGWDTYVLIGHSMGSIISIQYAATFPEQIETLVLLDGYGPEAEAAVDDDFSNQSIISQRLRRHIARRYAINHPTEEGTILKRKIYPTIEAATKTRMKTATNSPGNQWLSETAARELVQRALIPVPHHHHQNDDKGRIVNYHHQHQQHYIFRHDPRLIAVGPILLHTLDQVDEYWNHITTFCRQTIWLRAQFGWPFDTDLIRRATTKLAASSSTTNNKKVVVEVLPGSHHFHADPETGHLVVDAVLRHILTPPPSTNISTMTQQQQQSTDADSSHQWVEIEGKKMHFEIVVTPEEYR